MNGISSKISDYRNKLNSRDLLYLTVFIYCYIIDVREISVNNLKKNKFTRNFLSYMFSFLCKK